MPLAAQIITFLPPARGVAFGCGCAMATLVVCAIASDAEVTANPERKSLRFMEPHLSGDLKDAENITLHSCFLEFPIPRRVLPLTATVWLGRESASAINANHTNSTLFASMRGPICWT